MISPTLRRLRLGLRRLHLQQRVAAAALRQLRRGLGEAQLQRVLLLDLGDQWMTEKWLFPGTC